MDSREIYFAGGCFWGTEHYIRQFEGVTETVTGYANGIFVAEVSAWYGAAIFQMIVYYRMIRKLHLLLKA